jgi:hypothetical protein
MSSVPRRDGTKKGFRFGRKAEAEAGRKERMAVHEEAARLQQGTAFQPDGGLEKGDAYKKAAQNYDAGSTGGRTWGSRDYTYTTPKEKNNGN